MTLIFFFKNNFILLFRSILRHQSRLPTPRSSRSSTQPIFAQNSESFQANRSSVLPTPISLMLTRNKPPIPASSSNTSLHNSMLTKEALNSKKLLLNQQQVTSVKMNSKSMKATLINMSSSSANRQQTTITPNRNSNGNNKSLISPSGLLTDGPLNRKSSVSPSRLDRSKSPTDKKTSLQTIHESKTSQTTNTRAQTPLSAQKYGRRSLLPQPSNLQSGLRKPSVSPSRYFS